MSDFVETTELFGEAENLFGMLAVPTGARLGDFGCLVLNTGVNHRIGPHRINVKTARRLAGAGIPTLRFDLAGIGDSSAARSRHDFRTQAVEDMKSALDHLESRHGLRRFLVFGICSGAENALAVALADPRVRGVLTFDGPMYLTRGVRLERKLRRMAAFPGNPAVRASYPWWRDLVQWLGQRDAAAGRRTLERLHMPMFGGGGPSADEGAIFQGGGTAPVVCAAEYERRLLSLVDRGVAVSLMYSATYNARDRKHGMLSQLRGSPVFDRLQYRFWPDVDHTATTLAMQAKLLTAVEEWARGVALGGPGLRPSSAGSSVSTLSRSPDREPRAPATV
ncbi:alpha/beta fold hydrolase [Hydrogenophaga sp.]|uniref:alpha/beta fold hydrolase n=1 Tax=Hydrogenophaga sp. TaxID=1904254 RepID=UPI00271D5ED2|nr:alpha/beta fold hydrolase [Hydrogenophaga sp.]MDO9435793.1 alpha/beta hydrolase [Hydrogenophaga sp.]